MASSAAPIQARPYRSHRVPACIRCRSRKIRCHIDIPGEPCLSCRERRLKCQYADAATPPDENGDPRRQKRRRTSNGNGTDDTPARPRSAPILHKPTSNTSASIILAPHVAEDVDILHRHIWQHQKKGPEATDQYQTLSHNTHDPIVYLTVPRFRTGLRPEIGCGKEQLEIVAQIMGPFKREVIDLYFTHHHYHFPILDDDQCLLLRKGEIDKIPNNLLCVVYAMSMPHWRKSDTLKMHPRPDHYYIWNKAISAILEDFLSPGMSTIAAALLDQIGRPSVSIVGNITLCGRTIALAQTFGLHRDPSKWQITEAEKSVRMRLWWGVLITDYWASMGYGKPPNIAKGYYDVPRPTLNALITTKATMTQKCAATCFIHLYTLTELLGEILPMVYEIDPDRIELSRSVERLKGVFNNLESDLPEWMPLPNRPGTSNLWLCFLSIKLLLSRVTLRATILEGDTRLQKTRLDELRNTSSAVLDFVLSLSEPQFNDFWLPHTTHLLVHAITVSLRCTAETQDPDYRNTSIVRLQRVIAHIQDAHDNLDWDIAVYCLERCSEPVARIVSLINAAPTVIETAQTQAQQQQQKNPQLQQNPSASADTAADPHNLTHSSLNGISSSVPGAATGFGGPGSATGGDTQSLNMDDATFLLSDILDPNAFDFSWEALWDTPSGMTNFSI